MSNLLKANLRDANLSGAKLIEANLRWENLTNADLRETNLYKAKLRGADLGGAELHKAEVGYARWGDHSPKRPSRVLGALSSLWFQWFRRIDAQSEEPDPAPEALPRGSEGVQGDD